RPLVITPEPRTALYTPSLHAALPICADPYRDPCRGELRQGQGIGGGHDDTSRVSEGFGCRRPGFWLSPSCGERAERRSGDQCLGDRKSTRLNSSHQIISYAVFCLKKK